MKGVVIEIKSYLLQRSRDQHKAQYHVYSHLLMKAEGSFGKFLHCFSFYLTSN